MIAVASRVRAPLRELLEATAGAAMVETLIAFMPIFVLLLGIAQWALLGAAQLVVEHAARVGVRCAIVILPDDPKHYEGAALGSLTEGVRGRGPLGRVLDKAASLVGLETGHDGARMSDVRRCVHARMSALVPSDAVVRLLFGGPEHESLSSAIGDDDLARILNAPIHLAVTTAVTFPKTLGDRELHRESVPLEGDVVLRVSTLFPCLVPMVSALMCPRYRGALDEIELELEKDDPKRIALAELKLAPLAELQSLWMLRGPRMAVLMAEARLPVQSASYAYAEPKEETR